MNKFILNSNKGFTLIELLVAVAIIGVITGIIITSAAAIQSNARDAQRQNDLRTIQSALQQYSADNFKYPLTVSAATLQGTKNYLTKIPVDPSTGASYGYGVKPNNCDNSTVSCSNYCVAAILEHPPTATIPNACLNLSTDLSGFNYWITQP